MDFEYGRVEQISPLVRRVVARNPSPFTFYGTGTYIVGRGQVAVIDPGPNLMDHIDALCVALEGEELAHILITHTHSDHSPASRPLQSIRGGTIGGFGIHADLTPGLDWKVEEGRDIDFNSDMSLSHGDVISGDGWTIEALHTPGHMSNHLCYFLKEERTLFTGDHVMGWSTSVIIPPDGDMRDYIKSLEFLLDREDVVYWPTHGPSIRNPKSYVRALVDHRHMRLNQIVECVRNGITAVPEMVTAIYHDIPTGMHAAAARSTLAGLIMLVQNGELKCDGPADLHGKYYRIS